MYLFNKYRIYKVFNHRERKPQNMLHFKITQQPRRDRKTADLRVDKHKTASPDLHYSGHRTL